VIQINDEVRAIARREAAGKPTVTAKARALLRLGVGPHAVREWSLRYTDEPATRTAAAG